MEYNRGFDSRFDVALYRAMRYAKVPKPWQPPRGTVATRERPRTKAQSQHPGSQAVPGRALVTPYLAGIHAKLEQANLAARLLGLKKTFSLADVKTNGFDVKVAVTTGEVVEEAGVECGCGTVEGADVD